MHRFLVLLGLLLVLGSVLASPTWAVTAQANDLPFDNIGEGAVNSARNVWIPAIVVLGLIALAGCFIFGMPRVSAMSVRTAIALAILGVAASGIGLGTMFPGLITSVTLL